jgi:hypothetical protein
MSTVTPEAASATIIPTVATIRFFMIVILS